MSTIKTSPLQKIAFFSLHEHNDGLNFASKLLDLDWIVLITPNMSSTFSQSGIQAEEISKFLGIQEAYPFPPTLHPRMELALTTLKTRTIDLVFDTTYPLSEGNDVGGHTLLALAAKGNRIVVSNRKDMAAVIQQLLQNENKIEADLRERLIAQAYEKNSRHYQELTNHKEPNKAKLSHELAEGENPYQVPAHLLTSLDSDDLCLNQFFSNSSYTVEPDEILQNQKQELRARTISRNIRCLICQNQSIDESNAPFAKDLRVLIRDKIKEGKKDQEIYKFLTDRYGDFILLKPPLKLSTLALWFLPFIFFIIGIVVILSHNKKSR